MRYAGRNAQHCWCVRGQHCLYSRQRLWQQVQLLQEQSVRQVHASSGVAVTPESMYAKAALLASDTSTARALEGMKQLCAGWSQALSPAPVHKLLSEKLAVAEGRAQHQALFLQLTKAGAEDEPLTVNHARLWQFLSLRFFPTNPQGLMQFQAELATILEALVRPTEEKPRLVLG